MSEPKIIALIEACYAAAFDFEAWPRILAQVASAVGAHGSALVPQDERRSAHIIASDSPAEAHAAYRSVWWQQASWAAAAKTFLLHNGLVLRESDLIKFENRHSDAFFQIFCQTYHLGDLAACLFIDPRDQNLYSIVVFKNQEQGPYSTEEIERLHLLTPHVARAFTLGTALSDARDQAVDLTVGFERLSFGTIVLDGASRVRNINSIAGRFFRNYLRQDGDQHLHALYPGDRERFERLLVAARPGGIISASLNMMLRPVREGHPLLVEVLPLRCTETALSPADTGRGGALLFLYDVFAPAHPDIEELLVQLGLSHAEARLAQLVGRGHSPRTAASVLRIAEGTARVHLRSCFAKLGIVRQSELAVLITRLDTLTCPSTRS
ncbi:MAG TPA: hypothetical protein K8W01_00280 [Methylorubrum populi]|uniref:HTH luxR-type domain-containing protein n=1 Tax=Methylorubrum populi TaxID=223967 RepID=A0A921JCS9_9HYPH|nr:hypothetical protein [Methylorubrum populi]